MKIVKMSYSASPWRLVNDDGQEVNATMPMDHANLGMTMVTMAISGKTKAECIDASLKLLSTLMKKQKRQAS